MKIEDRMRERIAAIPEPCALALGRTTTIGEMGLIDDIVFAEGHATITLCLTDTACVHFIALKSYVSDRLLALPEVTSVSVVQTLTELWTPDRMSTT